MMRLYLLNLLLIVAMACSDANKVPSGIIREDKMTRILWDMIQADRYAEIYLSKDTSKLNPRQETFKLYEEIFQIHNISRSSFIKSYRFYLDHPNITSVMFDSLAQQANRQRPDLYKSAQ